MCVLSLQKSHDADQDDADEGIKELTELALKKLVILTVCGGVGGGCMYVHAYIYTCLCTCVYIHMFVFVSSVLPVCACFFDNIH